MENKAEAENRDIKVSVACITFNHLPFIARCLDGFLNQKTNFNIEVLVHDDASTDGTAEIIQQYYSRFPEIIKPILQKENQYSKGESITFKYNLPRARGKYIAICEGDDCWTDPYKLQKQVDFLEQHSDFVLTFHNVEVVDQDGKTLIPSRLNYTTDQDFSAEDINMIHIPTLSVLFRNGLVNKYLIPKVFNGDIFLLGLLSKYGKAHYHHFIGAKYNKHAGGVYSSAANFKRHSNSIKSRELLLPHLPAYLQKSVRTRMNNFYINILNELLSNKKPSLFIKYNIMFLKNCLAAGTMAVYWKYHSNLAGRIFGLNKKTRQNAIASLNTNE